MILCKARVVSPVNHRYSPPSGKKNLSRWLYADNALNVECLSITKVKKNAAESQKQGVPTVGVATKGGLDQKTIEGLECAFSNGGL